MKKIKRLGIIYDPLNISTSLLVRGGSLTQTHSAEDSEYVPDRELTPLVIVPEVYVEDPNGIIPNGKVSLSNVLWYALPQDMIDNVDSLSYLNDEISKYLITAASDGYEVESDGTLVVSKNIPYLAPVVLVFTASYLDGRSGRVIRIQATATLSTTSVAVTPVLSLDKPGSFVFNPIEDSGLRTITASLLVGGKTPESIGGKTSYWWYKVIDGAESLVDPDEDLFYESGEGTAELSVDPRYIDGRLELVCKAEYALEGNALPSSPTSKCMTAKTVILRRYPDYEFENYVHGGVEVPSGAVEVKNECVVTIGRKVLDSPSQWFSVKWSILKAVYGAEWITLGYGDSIMIDAKEFENGADVGLEVEEFEPLGAMMMDGETVCIDGEVITF